MDRQMDGGGAVISAWLEIKNNLFFIFGGPGGSYVESNTCTCSIKVSGQEDLITEKRYAQQGISIHISNMEAIQSDFFCSYRKKDD